MRSLKTDLSPAQIKELENISKSDSGKFFIEKLCTRISKDIEINENSSESLAQFEVPNWDLKQAFMLGYRKALKDVQKQITNI